MLDQAAFMVEYQSNTELLFLILALWHCWTIIFYHAFWLLIFPVIQDSLQRCDVTEYSGSVPAGLYSLGHKRISSQACQSPGRCATWGARQILFCTKTLHQSHYKTEVSSWISIKNTVSSQNFESTRKEVLICCLTLFLCIGMGKETPQILYFQMCWWGRAQRIFRGQTISGKLFQNIVIIILFYFFY